MKQKSDDALWAFKNKLISTIKKHCPNATIYLFGSRALGCQTETSDIDIALDAGKRIDIHTLGTIKDAISTLNIPFFVDIVDVHRVNDVMKQHIQTHGVLWNS